MPFNYLNTILEGGQVRIPYDSNNRRLFLSENNVRSGISKLEITGFDKNSNCLAFRLDGLKKPRKTHLYLKNSASDIHRGCDGVLIFRFNGCGYILICELKSNCVSGVRKQFKSSYAFLDYLSSLAKRFGDSDLSGFKRRSVLFTTRSCADKTPIKHKTSPKKPIEDEKPGEYFCDPNKRDVPSFSIKRLLELD